MNQLMKLLPCLSIFAIFGCSGSDIEIVKDIKPPCVLMLYSKNVVALQGLQIIPGKEEIALSTLRDFLIGKKIIFKKTEMSSSDSENSMQFGEIYILGEEMVYNDNGSPKYEYVGFSDIDLGIFRGKGKVLALNLRSWLKVNQLIE